MKKECVTMILAGGVGKRLGSLTKNIAKPAVPFGGSYRIIDFTLSNCLHSRMYTVGVLTQYSPLVLHKHIGVGKPWDLDRQGDGLSILSPCTNHNGGDGYLGTADAITKNISFVERYDPEYLIVLSGDHIYNMNYDEMLRHHKDKKAELTLSVIEVPWEETSRFGIVNTTEDLRIYEFEEKPAQAKSNLASMGIYIFNWKLLKSYLQRDALLPMSHHDFGQDIIPAMLADQRLLYAYRFAGYWKDVGTIHSYWEAHMDLLKEDLPRSSHCQGWRTYSHDTNCAPQFIGGQSRIHHSLVNNGCIVSGHLDHCVLFENVEIGEGSVVHQSILLPGVQVGQDVLLDRVIVQENVAIPDHLSIVAAADEEPILVSDEYLANLMVADVEVGM